jgi:hypothetical protein
MTWPHILEDFNLHKYHCENLTILEIGGDFFSLPFLFTDDLQRKGAYQSQYSLDG